MKDYTEQEWNAEDIMASMKLKAAERDWIGRVDMFGALPA